MIQYVMNNLEQIIAVITGVVAVASVIAKLTPNTVDDAWVAGILKVVDFLAVNTKPTEKRNL